MKKWLKERSIEFNEQIRVPELGKLSFDFEILSKGKRIGFIEVQGEQHYEEVFHYPSRLNYFKTQ